MVWMKTTGGSGKAEGFADEQTISKPTLAAATQAIAIYYEKLNSIPSELY